MKSVTKYVIIGNSISGVSAINTIRECDAEGKVTVISDESSPNYSRPLISYLLGKRVASDNINFCKKSFYKENKVKLILNKKASKLDLKKRCVVLENKQKIPFDKLLIATGGTPIIPKIKGGDLNGVFTFTNLSDTQKIDRYIKTNKVKKALVIGGGLIGLKATEALINLGIKVTIVELAERILSATFDKKASNIIENALKKIGCDLITNNSVIEIRGGDKKVKEVTLKNKQKIPVDLVVIAIGVKPNIELTQDTSIKTNKGILVNQFMQTNIKDVYASGDCCEAPDLLYGDNRTIAIWPVAAREGKIAGYNMAGKITEYSGSFAMNSVELCGIPTISVGQTDLDGKNVEILEYSDRNKSVYKKIVIKNEKILGVILIGNIERSGIYTGLIKDKVDVSSFKEYLLKEDFGLVHLPQTYRKHLVSGEVAII